jgi:hypothetical protein
VTTKPIETHTLSAKLRKHIGALNHRVTGDRRFLKAAAVAVEKSARDLARTRLRVKTLTERNQALQRQLTTALSDLRAARRKLEELRG